MPQKAAEFQERYRQIAALREELEKQETALFQSFREDPSPSCTPSYGDLTALNTEGRILKALGRPLLLEIARDFMSLLDTSCAVYERNGDYALGLFHSGWCRMLDEASRALCGEKNNEEALCCGTWWCHESCWTDCSQRAIESNQPTEIECHGGIRIFAVPIRLNGEVMGAINFGFGTPPQDPQSQQEIARKYGLPLDEISTAALAYRPRPSWIIDFARQRLSTSARLIAEIVSRREIERQLRLERDRVQRYLDVADVILLVIDPQQNVAMINRKGCHILGYQEDEIVGKNWFDHFIVSDELDQVKRVFDQLMAGKIEPANVFENRIRSRDGSEHVIAWNNTVLGDDHGTICGTLSSGEDVTASRQMESSLRQAEKMHAVGQLAGGVAHDFNNQLGGILTFAELIRDQVAEPDLKRFANNIVQIAQRSAGLTQQLLAFARKGKYRQAPINIHHVIRDVVTILEHTLDKSIAVQTDDIARFPITTGDANQLQNAILNIALNARDAMPAGGTLHFETENVILDETFCSAHPYEIMPGNYIRISVTDTGIGMDKKTRDRAFEPFFTTKEVGKGSGMGLAAVWGSIKNHGGAVGIYSEVGRGTTIKVYLPVAVMEEDVTDKDPKNGKNTQPLRILVVDDEEMIRLSMAETLRALGHQAVTAKDGKAALEYYGKSWAHVDLVLLDMVMPNMGGRETFVAMRLINPNVRAVLMSGYSINGQAQEILDEGVRGFVQKPASRPDLAEAIDKAMQD